jgi:hypothetical protein
MQEAIDRIMQAYTLMVTLSPEAEADVRERLVEHLRDTNGDENARAIEGLRFLRGPDRPPRRRRR